uniref:Uncharacterized protein n=1 Tax=Lotus japonicus TaxID=34305 RepID=I3S3N7_LOTJA|nr:unknown [Lotus japonicus]
MARKSSYYQLLAGLVGRMTSLALLISPLEGCASFWLWLLPLYISSSQGNREIPHICHGIGIQEGTRERNKSCLFVIPSVMRHGSSTVEGVVFVYLC